MSDEVDGGTSETPCVLYHGPGVTPDGVHVHWRPAHELLARSTTLATAGVLLVDASLLGRIGNPDIIPGHVIVVAIDSRSEKALGSRVEISLAGIHSANVRNMIIRAACQLATARMNAVYSDEEFQELRRVSMGLMRQHDRMVLLRMIVSQGKIMTRSDGAGMLLLERQADGSQLLRPMLWAFDFIAREEGSEAPDIPVDGRTILGRAVLEKQSVVVANASQTADLEFELAAAFAGRVGYRLRSMLVVPMIDQLGKVSGLLVFMNRKTDPKAQITSNQAADRYVVPYSSREVQLARLLSSQAAVAMENVRVQEQIERLLDIFVKTSVHAIGERDPATTGHAARVAEMAARLAEAVTRTETGPYKNVKFSMAQLRELRLAALLHEFGNGAAGDDVSSNEPKLPRTIPGNEVPLQTRLIAVADIFDALTAADRPSRPGIPPRRAVELLKAEADAGGVDAELVRLLEQSLA